MCGCRITGPADDGYRPRPALIHGDHALLFGGGYVAQALALARRLAT